MQGTNPPGPILQDIPIELLDLDNAFQYRSEVQVDSLVNSIRDDGQIVPILVRPAGNGRYQLIGGYRRVNALKRLKRPVARALILNDLSDRKSVHVALLENLQREGLTDRDKVLTALRLLEEGMSKAEIAKSFSTTIRTIERYIVVARAPEEFLTALQRGEVSIHAVYEAVRKGVPLSELRKPGRSVQFLRQLSRRERKKTEETFSFRARFVLGKSDPALVIREAEEFISCVKAAVAGRGRREAATPRRRGSPPPKTSRSGD